MHGYGSTTHHSRSPVRLAQTSRTEHRRAIVALASFVAVTSLVGGVTLLALPHGSELIPLSLVDHTPFASFLIPGLILTLLVSGTNAACALFALRRARFTADATVLAGGTLLVWILAEAALMREINWLHVVYGSVGAVLLALGVLAAWRSGYSRYRWIVAVTIAETLGFFVPACVGVLATARHLSPPVQALLVVVAGFVEGFVLGFGQAVVFPLPLRRLRYALLTSLGAGVVWASVMAMTAFFGNEVSPLLMVLIGVIVGLTGLLAIGTAQWIELRHYAPRAGRWIFWTACAWALALPLSFAPSPFVDESTPLGANLVLWACGGLLMALVMALVTWQGVRSVFMRPQPDSAA